MPDVWLYLALLIRLVESNIKTSHLSPNLHEIRIHRLSQATTTILCTLQANFELLIERNRCLHLLFYFQVYS